MNLDRAFAHPPTFTTERLRVRPIELTDAEAIFQIKSDQTVTGRYGRKPSSWEETQAWLRDEEATPTRADSSLPSTTRRRNAQPEPQFTSVRKT